MISPQEPLNLILSTFSVSSGAFYVLQFLGNSSFDALAIQLCMPHLPFSFLFCPHLHLHPKPLLHQLLWNNALLLWQWFWAMSVSPSCQNNLFLTAFQWAMQQAVEPGTHWFARTWQFEFTFWASLSHLASSQLNHWHLIDGKLFSHNRCQALHRGLVSDPGLQNWLGRFFKSNLSTQRQL